MITFLGRHILQSTKLGPFLNSIYGLGKNSSIKICKFIGLPYSSNVLSIDSEKIIYLQQYFVDVKLEADLRRQVGENLQLKLKLQTYTGLRLSQGLPSRGQRTKTNSRTSKKFRTFIKRLFFNIHF
jgi:small subunit ribosomal protein S13